MKDMENKKTVTVVETATRKVCSKHQEHFIKNMTSHTTKNVPEVVEQKHVGIKFNGEKKKKLTVPIPFSFDTGPKVRKEKVLMTPEKPAGKNKDERNQPKNAKESSKVTKDTPSRNKTRSPSPGKTQKNPESIPGYAREKSSCTRCSRHKADAHKATDSPSTPVKSQSSNVTKTHEKSKKEEQPSNTVKSQVHFSAAERREVKVTTSTEKSKSEASKDNVLKIEATQPKLPNGLEMKMGNFESRPLNGISEPGSLDVIDNALANEVNFHCEYSETKIVESSSMTKSASKIPRKKYGAHTGLKFPANFRKETIPQPFRFENRFSNLKKENMQIEANEMKMTNIVN